jgi:hypothetical protein
MLFRYFNLAFGLVSALTNCTPENGIMKNVSLSLSPEVPKAGDTYYLTIQGIPSKTITVEDQSSVYLTASLSGFPIGKQTTSLCDGSLPTNTPCPLVKDTPLNMTWTGAIPDGVHGTLVLHEEWATGAAEPILCFEMKVLL